VKDIVDLAIREVDLADAEPLGVLMGELGYPTTKDEMERRLHAIAADSHYKTFVAVSSGRVCGMIGTSAGPSYEHNDRSGRIVALVVSEAMRRQGIARQLINAAEQDFSGRGITRISLTTRLTRAGAHRFYEELGYERTGHRFAKNLTAP
jgi:ribosomal protein S18 acetylase RimI-like enzyme